MCRNMRYAKLNTGEIDVVFVFAFQFMEIRYFLNVEGEVSSAASWSGSRRFDWLGVRLFESVGGTSCFQSPAEMCPNATKSVTLPGIKGDVR